MEIPGIINIVSLQNPIDISPSQFSTFDDLAEEYDLDDIIRSTKPLNGRTVYDMDTTSQVISLKDIS